MTIALIVVTKPSRTLLAACILMLALAHGCLFVSIEVFAFSFYWKVALVFVSYCMSIYLMYKYWLRTQQSRQISISAIGEIVLHLAQGVNGKVQGINVTLSHKSRIWPYFLSIFLRDEQGKEYKLLIMRDSLTPATFRRLKVSLMWVAQHPSR